VSNLLCNRYNQDTLLCRLKEASSEIPKKDI